ncbi:MAG TPA: hypothetical protein VK324_15420 [Tepidisphaeraceae bacterium]|nr:hypothetical protein [Tepidisphaeraceae bacterium]
MSHPIRVRLSATDQPRPFGGVGFHCFDHLHSSPGDHYDRVIVKRWRELNPSFARLTDRYDLPPDQQQWLAANIRRLRDDTGTSVYLTTWNPAPTEPGPERATYARRVVDNLEYLVRDQQLDNLRWYCMTNELSLKGWGVLRDDLPTFADYHAEIHRELRRRDLSIDLLATDASPIMFWHTIEWARQHMDDITGAYGGHHYFNDHPPADPGTYDYFLEQTRWATALAGRKPFIIGEFGAAQHKGARYGITNWDGCRWFDTDAEPLIGVQLAEAIAATINGGTYAVGYWTFADFPDPKEPRYANKWGTFRWSGDDHSIRPIYNALGPLTRFFRGPADVLDVASGDPLVRAAAVRRGDGLSVVVVNRLDRPAGIELSLPGDAGEQPRAFRRYTYDPAAVRVSRFGDLLGPDATIAARDGRVIDEVPAGAFAVYTTAYADDVPAAVADVRAADGGVTWSPTAGAIYYRVYRAGQQIGSTAALTWVQDAPAGQYAVRAVNVHGNEGP